MCGALVYHWKVVIPFADNGLLPQLTDVMQRVLLASGVLFFDLLEVQPSCSGSLRALKPPLGPIAHDDRRLVLHEDPD